MRSLWAKAFVAQDISISDSLLRSLCVGSLFGFIGYFPSSPFSGRIVILPFWSYDPCHPRTVVPQCHEFCSYPERARAAQVIQFRRHVPLKTTVFPQCQVIFRYIFGWECAALFQTKIYDFSCSTSAWLSKCIPYFRPCKVLQFRELWIRFTVKPYGTL